MSARAIALLMLMYGTASAGDPPKAEWPKLIGPR
jgi:hypothetical protein